MKRKYDYIISLGEKCFIAQTLHFIGARKFSSPFDWVGIHEFTKNSCVVGRINLILNNFKNFFDKKEDFIPLYNRESYFFVNKNTGFAFRHEFVDLDDFDKNFDLIKEKYDRRCKRLIEILQSNKKILFVYSSSLFPINDKKQVIEAINLLNKKFNTNKIDLLIVESNKNLNRQNKIKYKKINSNIIWVSGVDLYKPVSNKSPEYYIKTLSKIIKTKAEIKPGNVQTIISLTSFPARINNIHIVIKSLLKQSVKPDKIVLYLSEQEFPEKNIPDNLKNLMGQIFEIRFVKENFKSYAKLIYALTDFPNSNIVTVDDDILYPKNLLSTLLKEHKKNPKTICAHRIRKINIQNEVIMPYRTWKLSEKRSLVSKPLKPDFKNFFCGVGGVLYPPRSLHPDVLNCDKFLKLCAHQDDVWFWAMAVKNNHKISVTRFGYNLFKRTIQSLQEVGLWNTINSNNTESPNNKAIEAVLKEYPEIRKKIVA